MKLDERLINEKRELEKKNNNKQIRVQQEEDETGMA